MVNISTRWAYNQLNVHGRRRPYLDRIQSFRTESPDLFYNDFEKVIFKKYPVIEDIKETMYILGAEFASLSGSGSSVYGFFKYKNTEPAFKYFKDNDYRVFRIKS